jgi:epoxyqueuosine reductase QueG
VLKAEYDTRTAAGVGGQTPVLKGLFATFTLAAYIRELGYRATRVFAEDKRAQRLAAAAGLGHVHADGGLVTPQFGRGVYVAEVIFTDLPLQPDGQEIAA